MVRSMFTPALRIAIALVVIAYCASRLIAVWRERVCVTFLGWKYYKSEKKTFYWLAILGHVWLSLAMVANIIHDFRKL
jgi:hypothetical protein